jgi:hypothetical protein
MPATFEPVAGRSDDRSELRGLWTRRATLTVLLVFPVAAALNAFGQQPSTSSTGGAPVRVALEAPRVVRGGLLFQSTLQIDAERTVDHLRLVLDDGWFEGMQISSIEPQPTSEASRDGRVVLSYGRLRSGERLVVWVQSQVDPTNPGRRKYGLTVQDATTDIARIDRTITILP